MAAGLGPGAALFLVDVQQDFCPGGALAVPEGDQVVPLLSRLMDHFEIVVASRDIHPADHCSFARFGGRWPVHCVQGSPGAELHPGLRRDRIRMEIEKATASDREAYSAFEREDLAAELREMGVSHLYVGGLATDYCVKETVLDALRHGFAVSLLLDCTRSVNFAPAPSFSPGDGEQAIRAMVDAGATAVSGRRLLAELEAALCS